VRIELYDRKQTKFVSAHTNALSCLALSMDGKRLATTSEKGTLVRVWNTADASLVQVRGGGRGGGGGRGAPV
jgi:WD40 repeat protein